MVHARIASSQVNRFLIVAQTKKSGMREAILQSAFTLFSHKGYSATTMAEIARASNMTVANLYVYFESKLAILHVLYQPWLAQQLEDLAEAVHKLRSPRSRMRRIFVGLWNDIPAADHGFANALVEALAVAPPEMVKSNELLLQLESFLANLVRESLPPERQHLMKNDLLPQLFWMAFDGFVINRHLGTQRDIPALAAALTDLMLGAEH